MVTTEGQTARFRFLRPHARSVMLAGDFNGWQTHQIPMRRTPDGWWEATLRLAPGSHRFRYLADGEWFIDYAGFGVEHGPFGLDGIVRVAQPQMADACEACPHAFQAA
jgi:1,4-alpha-glucan branching enzyme